MAPETVFRAAIDACPFGIVLVEPLGKILLANGEVERIFGYAQNELIGQAVEILVPANLRTQHSRHHGQFTAHPRLREAKNRKLSGRRKDGTEIPVEVGLSPIATNEGSIVLGAVVDITDRLHIERLKDDFVATVSHELRTPLTSISGSLSLLIGGATGALPDAAARLISIAETNCKRLVRLINDILDIEKIESGQVVFNFKRVDVRALAEQVIEANRGYADGFGVRIRLDAVSQAGEVAADPDRLEQVVTNLLSNAIKFSPRGGEVVVTTEQRGHSVRVSIRDHGGGIPAEFKRHVFEKFAQADATDARQKGGTGLGLSIVREIVVRLGGRIAFADADGGGTVFYVDLPGWAQIASRAIDSERAPDAARILYCEDDPDVA
jgi:PAS domain S-box-containing protein